ncbi:hypothetical protein QTG54_008506 [Skeletonema marinoi]|uniref:Uncharacterized protein n=1 Tax=Skeletonema marinoi TaxID=267567 RepID=A0AAD9DAK9_9STRA|nr:hypothetical protein QTG54_008506 [Skeletonema marinoi]
MMNAYDSLMSKSRSTKKRRRDNNNSANASTTSPSIPSNINGGSRFFPCPAGCGVHVSEVDINAHLDSDCPQLNGSCSNNEGDRPRGKDHNGHANEIKDSIEEGTNNTTNNLTNSQGAKSDNNSLPQSTAKANPKKCTNTNPTSNAFQHMMKKSAQVYSNNINIQQRFHLHNNEGMVSWTCEDDNKEADDVRAKQDSDVQWSATIILKKVKAIKLSEDGEKQQQQPVQERSIELTVSSSISPFSTTHQSPRQSSSTSTTSTTKPKLPRLVQRHSRLSISHLKSCLQKSIRRRAPLPAVRVAMELADKSWTDLIRRLPIIILEDSTLHPDFSLLVWLMIADSKGFVPSKELIVRVLQIVFEMASCPWQDEIAEHSNDDCSSGSPMKDRIDSGSDDDSKPTSFSLSSSSSTLFPTQQHKEQTTANSLEITTIRAMLLRAQYGGMKCDVDMLHSFSKIWLQRFNSVYAMPTTITSTSALSTNDDLNWNCIPSLIHAKARQESQRLVTMSMVNTPGVVALTTNDVCPAGIDFHCSQVVEHLLSRPDVYSSLCERLNPLLPPKSVTNRDWITSKVKTLIWNYSSGINRRRSLMGSTKQSDCDRMLKRIWDDVLSSPFDDYVKKFVKDRLY